MGKSKDHYSSVFPRLDALGGGVLIPLMTILQNSVSANRRINYSCWEAFLAFTVRLQTVFGHINCPASTIYLFEIY